MTVKIIGAILILAGCGGVGFSMAAAHRKEENALRQLMGALDYMSCELQYRLTPLPSLCRQAAESCNGPVGKLLNRLASELDSQIAPDAVACMYAALVSSPALPKRVHQILTQLGASLGRFDLVGQLKGLEAARELCRQNLDILSKDRDVRLRTYQTLGLCAGAALTILFI